MVVVVVVAPAPCVLAARAQAATVVTVTTPMLVLGHPCLGPASSWETCPLLQSWSGCRPSSLHLQRGMRPAQAAPSPAGG
jgi:hypothetical protein